MQSRRVGSGGGYRRAADMDSMIQQLHQQVSAGGGGGGPRSAAATVASTSASTGSSPAASLVVKDQQEAPMSATASALLRGIDQFDLFTTTTASSSSLGSRPAAQQRRLSAGKRLAAAPDAAAIDVHSGGFGSDEPIPVDAPRMSDAVMIGGGSAEGGDSDTYGSRVRYIGASSQRAPSSLGAGSDGQRFQASLQRATQSVYFEELQFQLS
jgi:hypothetical protein